MQGNGKLPYMTFYMNDFFSDDKVVVMDRAQIGSYLCLLHAAWQQPQPGTLPDDDELLAKWAKCDSLDWEVEKGTIMAPFKKVNGIWCQKRMMAEALKAKRLHDLRVEAGQRGGASKARRLLKPSCSEALACASDSDSVSGSVSEGEVQGREENAWEPRRRDPNGPPVVCRDPEYVDPEQLPFKGGALETDDVKRRMRALFKNWAEKGKRLTRWEFDTLMLRVHKEFKTEKQLLAEINRTLSRGRWHLRMPNETGEMVQ